MVQRNKSRPAGSALDRAASLPRPRGEGEAAAGVGDSLNARVERRAGTPANRGEGQAKRVPSPGAGALHSGDEPQVSLIPASETSPVYPDILPAPKEGSSLSDYKGTSLKNIGKDRHGKVIPHVYSKPIAKKVAIWIAGGYNANDICIALNMRPGKLEQLYGQEIRHGLEQVGMEVTQHIVSRVKKSDRMAIFFAKSRMGWRDGDGKPVDTGLLNIHIHT